MTDDEPEISNEGSSEIKGAPSIRVDVKATDLLGIGAAAKTPAAEALIKGVLPSIGYAITSASYAMFGGRIARIDAERQLLAARTGGQVRIIEAQTDEQLRMIAGQRLIGEETRRQVTIEASVVEAVEIANESATEEPPSELPEEFAIKWVNGVKDASAPNVRSAYARLLASQVAPTPNRVSAPSLALLESLDGTLASALERFVCKLRVYGTFPWNKLVYPEIDAKSISLLLEIGFLVSRYSSRYLAYGFSINPKGRAYEVKEYESLVLSVRGEELAGAIYTPEYIHQVLTEKPLLHEEVARDIVTMTSQLSADHPELCSIAIETPENEFYEFRVTLKSKGRNPNTRNEMLIVVRSIDDLNQMNILLDKSKEYIFNQLLNVFTLEYVRPPD